MLFRFYIHSINNSLYYRVNDRLDEIEFKEDLTFQKAKYLCHKTNQAYDQSYNNSYFSKIIENSLLEELNIR